MITPSKNLEAVSFAILNKKAFTKNSLAARNRYR
jgi:hypothetical protein